MFRFQCGTVKKSKRKSLESRRNEKLTLKMIIDLQCLFLHEADKFHIPILLSFPPTSSRVSILSILITQFHIPMEIHNPATTAQVMRFLVHLIAQITNMRMSFTMGTTTMIIRI